MKSRERDLLAVKIEVPNYREPGSFMQIDKSILTDFRLNDKELRVLLYMLSKRDYVFRTWKIAEEFGVSQNTIKRAIGKLKTLGYVRVEKIKEGSDYLGDKYYVNEMACPGYNQPYTNKVDKTGYSTGPFDETPRVQNSPTGDHPQVQNSTGGYRHGWEKAQHKNTNPLSKLIDQEKEEEISFGTEMKRTKNDTLQKCAAIYNNDPSTYNEVLQKKEEVSFFANESELTEQGSDRPSEPTQETNQQNQVNNEQQVEAKSITPPSFANKGQVDDAEESFPSSSGKQLSSQKNIEARVRVENSRNTIVDPMKARMEANKKAAMLSKSKTQYYDGELKAILEYGLKEGELDAFCRWYHRNITQNNSSYRQDTYEFQTTRKRAFKGKYSNDDLVDLQGNISRYLAHKETKEKRSAPRVDVIVENPVVDLDKVKSVLDKYRKNTDVKLSQNG